MASAATARRRSDGISERQKRESIWWQKTATVACGQSFRLLIVTTALSHGSMT
jgi:hypothetical protein